MLIVISTFALDFIHSDRSIFKIGDLDEAWAFLNVAQGETLSNKLVRAGPVSYTHLDVYKRQEYANTQIRKLTSDEIQKYMSER